MSEIFFGILLLGTGILSAAWMFEAQIVGIFVSTSDFHVDLNSLQPAILLGVEEANKRYPHIKFNVTFRNSSMACTESYAGVFAAEEYYVRRVTAFIGPACSIALDSVGRMAAYWNLPTYTAGGVDTAFSKKSVFTTLTRLSFSLDQVSHFLKKILMKFQWHHVVVLSDETELSNDLLRRCLTTALKTNDQYEIASYFKEFSSRDPNVKLKKLLLEAKKEARVFVLVASGNVVRRILLDAFSLGMGSGEYAFLATELIKGQSNAKDFIWYQPGDERNKDARKMYECLLVVSVRVPLTDEYEWFVRKVTDISENQLSTILDPSSINPIVAAFYDCVLMYSWSVNKTLFEGGDPLDGYSLSRLLWNSTFFGVGVTGDIVINENGDREADYTLNDFDPDSGLMIPVATYYGARKVYDKIKGTEIKWPGREKAPSDIPPCGFTGEASECISRTVLRLWSSIATSLGVLVVAGFFIGYYIYRRERLELQLADHWWNIRWDEIEFIDSNDLRSMTSFSTRDEMKSLSTKPSTTAGSTFLPLPGAKFGTYKGIKVAVKLLKTNKLHVTRAMMIELKEMRDVTHENLLRFIGLCIEESNTSIITELPTRGTLSDMLENENINNDWMFRYSMITDIAEGMNFLHSSSIEYHGQLRSDNCFIDGRFVVKLGDYGLRWLMKETELKEFSNSRSLLWTAPEHLRCAYPSKQGSKKGDVYSFAIILQEIVTRCGPFQSLMKTGRKHTLLEPEEILDRLRMGTSPPFRPQIDPDECTLEMLDFINSCWDENPEMRPSFPAIRIMLKRITKGISGKNFLDNLLNRMEQYANNLESLVREKTQSLVEEQKKTEELLFQMIPRYVAEGLKKGCHVKPEMFESVTIFFSDIVGFTALSAESTPLQVVDLLNDLYSCFDSIIENFDVYKVETIGDAYMVASGLPIRNGNEHAREIASLALHLRTASENFRIRHMPNRKLKLRIGIHSGPCVAGVVGLKMPRYCLFGDTVNTASRMETTSEALKIHISHQTKLILETYGQFHIIPRGEIEVKGKGMMKTFWLEFENTQ